MIPHNANPYLLTGTQGPSPFTMPMQGGEVWAYQGDNTNDVSGNGNTWTDKTGRYVSGNGSSDVGLVPHTTDHNIAGKRVRISLWVRWSALPTSGQAIIRKGDFADAATGGWGISAENGGTIKYETRQGDNTLCHSVSTSVLPINVWHLVSGVFDDGEITSLQVNGVEDLSENLAFQGGYVDDLTTGLYVLARENNGTVGAHFAGDICALEMYDLDAGEYLGNWPMIEHGSMTLTGMPFFDASGNGYHGTWTGCTGGKQADTIPQTALMDWNRGYENLMRDSEGPWSFGTADGATFSGRTLTFGSASLSRLTGFQDVASTHAKAGDTLVLKIWVRSSTAKRFRIAFWNGSSPTYGTDQITTSEYQMFSFSASAVTGTNTMYLVNQSAGGTGSIEIEKIWIYRSNHVEKEEYYTTAGKAVLREFAIPASTANPTQDALGNPIDNPRGRLLNYIGGEAYSEIADSASLDVTTGFTLFLVGNFWDDGADYLRYFDRWDHPNDKLAVIFYRAAGDSGTDGKVRLLLSSDGLIGTFNRHSAILQNQLSVIAVRFAASTQPDIFENGTSLTVTTESGTPPASIFTTDIPIRIPGSFFVDSEIPEIQMAAPLYYNRAMSDAEIVRVTNILKRHYGV